MAENNYLYMSKDAREDERYANFAMFENELNHYSPYFKGSHKPIIGKEDFVTWCKQNNKQFLLEEWDYEKNVSNPEDYFPKSEKVVMWKCNKETHSYPAPICFRTKYSSGCCYCSGKRVLIGFNDLKTWCEKNNQKNLIEEWDFEKNQNFPENYTRASHKKIMWICSICKNSYLASIADRTSKRSGCPYCAGRLPIIGKSDLRTWCERNDREDLVYDWDKKLNRGKDMEEFTYASNKEVVWKCHICSNEWKTPIYSRTVGNRGCSKCSVAGTSFPEQYLYLVVRSLFQTVTNRDKSNGFELDIFIPQYRIAIEYNGTYYHSKLEKNDGKKREKCKQKGIHLLQIYEKIKAVEITEEDILCWKYSRDKKDMEFLAQKVICWLNSCTNTKFTKNSIDWNMIYEYARINTYNVKYEDSLEYKSPKIAAEWDEQHNGGIKPSQISNGSHDIYSWICRKCGSTFQMKINDRTRKNGAGCPICGKEKQIASWINHRKRVKSFYDWCLENNKQHLLAEWDSNKNVLMPEAYPSGSSQKVWWKCKVCGNEWAATIYNRRKTRCNLCSKNKFKVPIIQYEGNCKLAEYESITEASGKTGISNRSIRNVLKGKQKKAGGFVWKLKTDLG